MFQQLRCSDRDRFVLGAAGKRNRTADRRAIVAAGHSDDEVFGVASTRAVGHGYRNGDHLRLASRKVLIGRVGRIETPRTVRVQSEARRRCLTQRICLRIARIHIRRRHLTRNRRAILGCRRRRRT